MSDRHVGLKPSLFYHWINEAQFLVEKVLQFSMDRKQLWGFERLNINDPWRKCPKPREFNGNGELFVGE